MSLECTRPSSGVYLWDANSCPETCGLQGGRLITLAQETGASHQTEVPDRPPCSSTDSLMQDICRTN